MPLEQYQYACLCGRQSIQVCTENDKRYTARHALIQSENI